MFDKPEIGLTALFVSIIYLTDFIVRFLCLEKFCHYFCSSLKFLSLTPDYRIACARFAVLNMEDKQRATKGLMWSYFENDTLYKMIGLHAKCGRMHGYVCMYVWICDRQSVCDGRWQF
jgi:hypothetical protein